MQTPKYSCGSDDITFCGDKCDRKTCFRHPANIIHREIPHSFANLKGTKLCSKEAECKEKKVWQMTYKEAAKRILNHMEIHARSEHPFAIHITEALELAVRTLIEAEQREQGGKINARWIKNEHMNYFQCSSCDVAAPHDAEGEEWLTLFCPKCGRKLGE